MTTTRQTTITTRELGQGLGVEAHCHKCGHSEIRPHGRYAWKRFHVEISERGTSVVVQCHCGNVDVHYVSDPA